MKILILCFLSIAVASAQVSGNEKLFSSAFSKNAKFKKSASPRLVEGIDKYLVEQPLDHLNTGDERIWQQSFYIDETNFELGGPIFVYISGQYEDTVFWLMETHIREISDELGGAVFALEPRFFGNNRPTEYVLLNLS